MNTGLLTVRTADTMRGATAQLGALAVFASAALYSRIVGSFERRNCSLAVASPVEEYFLAVDAML